MKKNLQSIMEEAGKYACLALDYIYTVLDFLQVPEHLRDGFAVAALIGAYKSGVFIENEFYVRNPVGLMKMVAEQIGAEIKCNVEKKENISSYKDLPETGYAAVRHDYNENNHWILAKDQFRVYDSLDDSVCVKNGKPTTARIITIERIR